MNVDLTVLVTSCDAYHDVEAPFLRLFRKHWPDCPFELVFLTETGLPVDALPIDTPGSDRVIATVAYSVTCQTGIWNREYLLGLARRNRSAWEFERYGSFMLEGEARPLLVTPTKECPFVDAVHKDYWEKFGVEVCERNGIAVDFAARGLPPFPVRVRESLKDRVFAIFPWTLIVRIQNFLNIGMKEQRGVK